MRSKLICCIAVLLGSGWMHIASASNIAVTNVTLTPCIEGGQTFVQFDISWDASWRASWTESTSWENWDAAWVFVKFRQSGDAGWSHATLSTNITEYSSPTGSTLSVGISTNSGGTNFGCGVFLYRSAEGGGSWTNNGVKLRWKYSVDGVANTSKVDVAVLAIEMVYVPQGNFYVGSGGTESGSFTEGNWASGNTIPFLIQSEAALTLTNVAEYLWGTSTSGNNTIGPAGELPAEYPKGYKAFYCMKYEISHGQWVDFFNMLTDTQKATRDITGGVYNSTGKASDAEVDRNTVSWVAGDATCTTPDRACNFLSWADLTAYADWAGLRPMTELEFEKACRGVMFPVANEYAWGNTTIIDTTGFDGSDGSGTETALPVNANCNYNNNDVLGPVRCGLYATASSTRTLAGATYWGIMEMSGNLWERPVTVGNTTGRLFTGAHGDGTLASDGQANADLWPGTSASGAGFRGGIWGNSAGHLRASDRYDAAATNGNRLRNYGGRGVRLAP